MAKDQQLEKAMSRLEAAVESLEKRGPATGGGGGDHRKEIADVRAMIGEAMQLIEGKPGGGGS